MCFLVLLNGFAYAKSERQILFACKTKNNKIIQLSKKMTAFIINLAKISSSLNGVFLYQLAKFMAQAHA